MKTEPSDLKIPWVQGERTKGVFNFSYSYVQPEPISRRTVFTHKEKKKLVNDQQVRIP